MKNAIEKTDEPKSFEDKINALLERNELQRGVIQDKTFVIKEKISNNQFLDLINFIESYNLIWKSEEGTLVIYLYSLPLL